MTKRGSSTTMLRPAARGHNGFDARYAARTSVHWFTWRHARLKLLETPDFSRKGWTILRLEVVAARDTPVPITNTGFLQHGLDADELATAGGAVAFVTAWMGREAQTKRYQKSETRWRQGDLFDQLALDEDKAP